MVAGDGPAQLLVANHDRAVAQRRDLIGEGGAGLVAVHAADVHAKCAYARIDTASIREMKGGDPEDQQHRQHGAEDANRESEWCPVATEGDSPS
jgi:hypothetical protein